MQGEFLTLLRTRLRPPLSYWFGGKLFHCFFFFLSRDLVDILDLVYLWADPVSKDLGLVLPICNTALGVAVMAEQGSAVWRCGRVELLWRRRRCVCWSWGRRRSSCTWLWLTECSSRCSAGCAVWCRCWEVLLQRWRLQRRGTIEQHKRNAFSDSFQTDSLPLVLSL